MKKQINIYYTIIFFISILLVFPLISKNYFIGHDTYYHLMNIEVIRKMILQLDFSKVVPAIGFDVGYGSGIFYPKLPHYCAAIIQLFTTNKFFGIKLSHFIVVFLSGIFMFKLLRLITNNNNTSLIGSIFYITMPYFLEDNFVRDAFNETFIFIFMPIILIGLISLLKQDRKNFYIYFIIGYVGMVNSHLVCSIFFTIALILFILVNIKKVIKKENIKELVLASIIIMIIICPSIIMMIEHKALNMYIVFDNKLMGTTLYKLKTNAVAKSNYLFMNKKGTVDYFINIAVYIFAFLGCTYAIFKEKSKETKQIIYGFVFFTLFSVFLTTRFFPYEYMPKLLWSIQFPFRCVAFVNFGISIIAAYGLNFIKDNKRIKAMIIATLISLLTGIFCINKQVYVSPSTMIYDPTYGMGWQREYLPKQANENYDYLYNRKQDIKIVSEKNSNIKIKTIENRTPYLKFKIDNVKDSTSLELPRLYYLGYDIKLKTKSGKTEKLKYDYDKYGFIKIDVKKSGIITIKYKGTVLYRFTKLLRLIMLMVIPLYFLLKRRKQND